MTGKDFERGDFEWKDGQVVWVPSKTGKYRVHPVLGPMPEDSPLVDVIIGDDMAKEIDQKLREKLNDINSKKK